MWRHPSFLIGAVLTVLLCLTALLSLVWTPHAYDAMAIADRLQGPSARHWLGTDQFGRDIAARLMVGARNSILVGVVAVGIGLVAGTGLGLLAAARGGWIAERQVTAITYSDKYGQVARNTVTPEMLG